MSAKGPSSPKRRSPAGGRRPVRSRPRFRLRWRAGALGRSRRRWLGLGLALLLLAAVLGGLAWWTGRGRGGVESSPVALGWPVGLGADDAAALLADLGLTDSPTGLALYFRVSGASGCFRAGAHLLPRGASPKQLRQLLCADPARPTARLTIPEGFTRFAIADRLEALGVASREAFVLASADAPLLRELGVEPGLDAELDSAEGYLFPATYELPLDSDPRDVVRRLVRELDRRWARHRAAHGPALGMLAKELGFGRREILTLASMVERETGAPEERPLVARVFLNRLLDPSFEPRLLQSDPTAAYGCLVLADRIPACRLAGGRPTPAVNHDPANRYSTYVNLRLPPGPIANPGDEAIAAVLAPTDGSYLYFVARGDGRHEFSTSYADHQRAVEALRRARSR